MHPDRAQPRPRITRPAPNVGTAIAAVVAATGALIGVTVVPNPTLSGAAAEPTTSPPAPATSPAPSSTSSSTSSAPSTSTSKSPSTTASSAPTNSTAAAGAFPVDDSGYVDSAARCDDNQVPVAFGRTSRALVAVCVASDGQLEYRGVRLSDEASVSMPASKAADGAIIADNSGVTYAVSPAMLLVSEGDTVIYRDNWIEFREPRFSQDTATPTTTTTSPASTSPTTTVTTTTVTVTPSLQDDN